MTDAAPPIPPSGLPAVPRYPADSRYAGVPTVTRALADGREVTWLRRRTVPQPDRLAAMHEHVVVPFDRLDTLAARYFGDSQLWWRIADANGALDPDELLRPGTRVRISHPQGSPGVPL